MLPHLSALCVERVRRVAGRVVIEARVRGAAAACPRCGQVSGRVHGGYVRQLRDAAAGGVQVVISLKVRRFRCGNAGCPAVTFAEQVAGLTRPHSRFTPLLRGLLTQIGLALAGRAGVRLAAAAGVAVGRDTLLRLVKALPEPAVGPVPVLGVDDFAFRKGRHYGTVLIDMATHRPVDIFDGRESADLAAWLRGHPEVAVICRDRSGGYGEGARQGAPQAVQVADRFHLWQNLGQAVEKTVSTRRAHLGEPAPGPPAGPAPAGSAAGPGEEDRHPDARSSYAAVHELQAQGLSKAAIGRKLGLHPATVRKFATARHRGGPDRQDRAARPPGRPLYRAPAPALARGRTQRHRAVPARSSSSATPAANWLSSATCGSSATAAATPHAGPGNPPSVRQVTSWIMTHPDDLDGATPPSCERHPRPRRDLDRLTAPRRAFAAMMTGRHGDRLDAWITAVETRHPRPGGSFARNLRRDLDAVRHGLTLPYSSGPVEGNINRLKMLKRQMFGRASLDLLRKTRTPGPS